MRFNVKVKVDERKAKNLIKLLSPKNSKTVDVGWWGDVHHSGHPVAQIAAWVEEGHYNGGMFSGTITPARPAVRVDWTPKAIKQLKEASPKIKEVLDGRKTWEDLYHEIGVEARDSLKNVIKQWNTIPNSPITIKLKGFNDPWVETGSTANAVKYRVTDFNKKEV